MRKLAVIFLSCFLISGLTAGEEKLSVSWTVRSIPRSWVTKGKIVAYDPGRANDTFFWNAVYFDTKGKSWPLLASLWNVVQMIRSEFPDGVDADFVRQNLVSAVTDFNAVETLFADDRSIETYIHDQFEFAHDNDNEKLMKQLVEKPVIKITGNSWSVQFMTLASLDRIRINSLRGALRPFAINTVTTETITDLYSDNLTRKSIMTALDHKIAILSRWGD